MLDKNWREIPCSQCKEKYCDLDMVVVEFNDDYEEYWCDDCFEYFPDKSPIKLIKEDIINASTN